MYIHIYVYIHMYIYIYIYIYTHTHGQCGTSRKVANFPLRAAARQPNRWTLAKPSQAPQGSSTTTPTS